MGALYRYETNWTSLTPWCLTNLFAEFWWDTINQQFSSTNWRWVADGVTDLKVQAMEQYGNAYTPAYLQSPNQFSYPVFYVDPILQSNFVFTNYCYTNLPSAVELEFGVLEPDALVQARALAAMTTPVALSIYLTTNGFLQTEVFRQRVTIGPTLR
jgi:hypothetical protein